MISWNHARLRREAGRLILEDLGSTNGTAVGQTSNRISAAEVQPTDVIFFGSLKVPVSRLLDRTSWCSAARRIRRPSA